MEQPEPSYFWTTSTSHYDTPPEHLHWTSVAAFWVSCATFGMALGLLAALALG